MNNEIELENMREQMNTLKKKLDKQEIINDNLIRQSLKRNTNSINRRYTVCSIEQVHDSVSLEGFAVEKGQKRAVVMGNEVKGVSQDVVDASDMCVEIPQHGTKHSLNISCCAAIVMWHVYTRLHP